MRADQSFYSPEKIKSDLEYQIEHYLAGGDLLPPQGWPFSEEAIGISVAVLSGENPDAAVQAAWDAFYAEYPEA